MTRSRAAPTLEVALRGTRIDRFAPPFVRRLLPTVACLAFALAMTLTRVVRERVYMDEQLFLGGAGLMARGAGLIYRDFFYTHAPTHPMLMSLLFRVTDRWVLTARVVDACCAALLATLIFESARRACFRSKDFWRCVIAASATAIFLFNPVSADAFGKAWNHDLAALACTLAFLLLATAFHRDRPRRWVAASGACAAIAVTTRLTYAPPMVAFALLFVLAPAPIDWRGRLRLFGWWSLGALIAASPSIYVVLQAPAAAWFENVRYPGLTARYYVSLNGEARATLATKFAYVGRVVWDSWSLTILVTLSAVLAIAAPRPSKARRSIVQARLIALLVLAVCAVAAMLAPTPIYHQYLYGPVPFLALLIPWSAASLGLTERPSARAAIVALAIVCFVSGWSDFRGVSKLAKPSAWMPNRSHQDGRRLAAKVAGEPGKVLTFMPGFALEAGLPIYSELSIGRFAARSADYLTPAQRERFNVPDVDAIRGWFAANPPPSAVLLSRPFSPLEAKIAEIAIARGYVEEPFIERSALFLLAGTPRTSPATRLSPTLPSEEETIP